MRGRGVLASVLSALLLPLLMNALAHAGTDTGAPGVVVTSPSPSGFTSYGGVRLQAIGVTGPTFDEYLGVGDLTPGTNRVEMNFNPSSFLLNGNSGGTAGDCNGNYGIGTTSAPGRNGLTFTWDATAGTLTARFVTATLDCTTLIRNVAQELANAKGWTLARAQTALTDVNALRIMADDRQTGTVLTMTGATVDGSAPLGTIDPGAGTSNTWMATDYDFDAPNGFTVSGTLNLGGTFGTCDGTCALEIKFGHFTPPNRPPVVSDHAADATGDHGTTLATRGSFTDPDGDPIAITWTGAGEVTDHGDGTWSWRYVPADDGIDAVSVTATDGKGGTATDESSWTAVNEPPVVADDANDATGHHGGSLTTHGSFTDPNGDALTITGSGAGTLTDNGDGTWSWLLVPTDDGSGSVTVTASDGMGGSATDRFDWSAVDAPPVVGDHAADATGHTGTALTTHGTFSDPDGDALSISSSGTGSLTDHGDGTWSWTFVPSSDGGGSVIVTASDGRGGSATDGFTWTSLNASPVVGDAANDQAGDEGDTLTAHGSFADPDGDPLSIAGSGAGAVTDHGDGTWSWTYVPADDGSGSVTVMASDGLGGTATDTFTWSASNLAPWIVSLTPDVDTVLAGNEVMWTAEAEDPGSGDTFTWWFDDGGGFAGGLTTTFSRTYDDCGTYTLHARIADDDGGSDQATSDASVTVVEAAALSPADPSGPTTVNTGQVLPVKVFVGCGALQSGLEPTIELLFGGETYPAETSSSADIAGVMRANQGQYQYNLRVPRSLGGVQLQKGDLVTVRVRPFGQDGGALRIVLQIRK